MEYLPTTLARIIKGYAKNEQIFPNLLIKFYAYEILR